MTRVDWSERVAEYERMLEELRVERRRYMSPKNPHARRAASEIKRIEGLLSTARHKARKDVV